MRTPVNALEVNRQPKAVSLALSCPALYLVITLIILVPVRAQDAGVQPAERDASQHSFSDHIFGENSNLLRPGGLFRPALPGCAMAARNDLHGRACFYADQLVAPSAMVHDLFSSSFAQWRNIPYMRHEDRDDIVTRISVFYERKAARNTGEFLAGYLHHEDFRPRVSGKTGLFLRSRAALLGVVTTPGQSGSGLRPAFAPIAGAVSSGFVEAANFPNRGLLETGLRGSTAVYAGYFVTAIFREFKPELVSFTNKALRRTK